MHKYLQLPSDFLFNNHKSLAKRRDFEDLCESLDELQQEAKEFSFKEGYSEGVKFTLYQFVIGNLNREKILEMYGDKLGLSEDEKFACTLPDRDRKVSMTEIRIENF